MIPEEEKELPCPNCGMLEKHWIVTDTDVGMDIFNELLGLPKQYPEGGFWTCPKLYDPVTKERYRGV